MQKLSPAGGLPSPEFDGHVVEYDLDPGESLVVDTGYLAAMDATCSMDVQAVRGSRMVFGGEESSTPLSPDRAMSISRPCPQVAGGLRPFFLGGVIAGPNRLAAAANSETKWRIAMIQLF